MAITAEPERYLNGVRLAGLTAQTVQMVVAIAQDEKRLTLVESVSDGTAQQADVWFSFSLPASDAASKVVSVCALDVAVVQAPQVEFLAEKERDISNMEARLRMAAKVFENNADGIYILWHRNSS